MNNLASLIKHADVVSFCESAKNISAAGKAPAKLIGVSINKTDITFKVYYELFCDPGVDNLDLLLGSNKNIPFYTYFKHWDTSKKSGLAVGVKVCNTSSSRYFHIKFGKRIIYPVVYPSILLIGIKDKQLNLDTGISAEIYSNTTLLKHYWYITEKSQIAKILAVKCPHLTPDLDEIKELEIYTAGTEMKINIIPELTENFKSKQDIVLLCNQIKDDETKQTAIGAVDFFRQNYKLEPIYFGETRAGIISVYWSLTSVPNNFLNL